MWFLSFRFAPYAAAAASASVCAFARAASNSTMQSVDAIQRETKPISELLVAVRVKVSSSLA